MHFTDHNSSPTDLRQFDQTVRQWLYTWDPCEQLPLYLPRSYYDIVLDFKYSVRLLSVFTVIFISLLVVGTPISTHRLYHN